MKRHLEIFAPFEEIPLKYLKIPLGPPLKKGEDKRNWAFSMSARFRQEDKKYEDRLNREKRERGNQKPYSFNSPPFLKEGQGGFL